jgi:hypothetical protein
MSYHSDLDQALRSAAEPVPARVTQVPARNLLEQIVRTDPQAAPVQATARRPRRRMRLTIAGVAGAFVALGAVALTLVGTGPAYASWSPDPTPLPAGEAENIVAKCVPAPEQGAASVVVGETRGDYAYLNAVTPGWSRTCFRDHNGTVSEASIHAEPRSREQLGAEDIELYGWSQLRTEEGYVRIMAGQLGAQIVGVDIVVRGGSTRTVHTTVRDGYFAAWYPEGVEEASTNTTTLTLSLADGRTVGDISARKLME